MDADGDCAEGRDNDPCIWRLADSYLACRLRDRFCLLGQGAWLVAVRWRGDAGDAVLDAGARSAKVSLTANTY